MRLYSALLCSNSSTLAKVLKADIAMSTINKKCWSAEFWMLFRVWKGAVISSIA